MRRGDVGGPAAARAPAHAAARLRRASAGSRSTSARAGDLFVIAGFPEVEIGDTLADPSDPKPLPRLAVDEPVLRMTFAVNTSPLAGREGRYLTSRHLRERLDREVLGNVSIRVEETDSPDVLSVAGRGELQLAVLIESMRREGYELQVSRPEVIVRDIDGKRHEPLERVVVDVPDEHVGTVTQAVAPRKGQVRRHPARRSGPVDPHLRGAGARTDRVPFAAAHRDARHRAHPSAQRRMDAVGGRAAAPPRWGADLRPRRQRPPATRSTTSRRAASSSSARATDVYEGMVVGESARPDDMVVNVTREKQKTNIRTHSHDEAIKLNPPRLLTLETAIEFIAEDELVEVTPASLRVASGSSASRPDAAPRGPERHRPEMRGSRTRRVRSVHAATGDQALRSAGRPVRASSADRSRRAPGGRSCAP